MILPLLESRQVSPHTLLLSCCHCAFQRLNLTRKQDPSQPPSAMSLQHLKPPYPPTTASLGGRPTVAVDVPITSVFLFLFILGAVGHMVILQVNMRRGHKFLISGMLFGFCMSRILTMIMRIVWATRITNTRVAIAANILVYAGVVLLFIVNIIFAQRIVRACHPNSGWHPIFHFFFVGIYVLIVITLIMLITSVIQSFYTLNANTKRIDRDILLYGQTFYAAISFLPIPLVLGGLVIPRTTRIEKFGHGRFTSKIVYLLLCSVLLCAGATFRVATNFAGGTRPANNPATYQDKACFYIFNFTVEIIVVLLYIVIRVDKRFYVPDHSKKAGDYSRGPDFYTRRKMGLETKDRGEGGIGEMIAPEEEVFDNMTPEEVISSDDKEHGIVEGSESPNDIPLEPMKPSTPLQDPATTTELPPSSVPDPVLTAKMPPTPAATPPPVVPHALTTETSKNEL